MLLQVFVISAFNFTACSVYVYMMYTIPSEWVLIFAQFCWLHIHGWFLVIISLAQTLLIFIVGFPPVIYLVLNKTIRDDARRMIFHCLVKYPRLTAVKDMFTTSNSNRIGAPSHFASH